MSIFRHTIISYTKSGYIFLYILVLTFICIPQISLAATGINQQIPYSGVIIGNNGAVLQGATRARFLIFDAPTGGVQLYEEIRDGVQSYPVTGVSPTIDVVDGRFEVLLGSQNIFDATILNNLNNDTLYLELQLDKDNNGSWEEIFAPRRRLGSTVSALNSLRLVANGDSDTLSLDGTGNVIATSLGGVANGTAPVGFDRVLLSNSSGQFSQVNISTLGGGGGSGWGLLGNATTDAWNGTTGTYLGTTSAQPLVFATTNATAQDIRFFTGANGANERLRIAGDGNIIAPILGGTANGAAPVGYDRVLLANSSGQLNQVDISTLGGGGVSQVDFDALEAEIIAARGSRSSLNLRITNISNFASPNALGFVEGAWITNSFHGTTLTTNTGAINRLELSPFYSSDPLRISSIGVSVSTASSTGGGTCRVLIYVDDGTGRPGDLIFAGTNLSTTTTGAKQETVDITLDNGRQYWIGVHWNSAAALRAISPTGGAVNLGLSGNSATTFFSVLRTSPTYGSHPATWSFSAAQRTVANPPAVIMQTTAP